MYQSPDRVPSLSLMLSPFSDRAPLLPCSPPAPPRPNRNRRQDRLPPALTVCPEREKHQVPVGPVSAIGGGLQPPNAGYKPAWSSENWSTESAFPGPPPTRYDTVPAPHLAFPRRWQLYHICLRCATTAHFTSLPVVSIQRVHQIEAFFAGIGGLGDFPRGCYLLIL